MTSNLGAAHRRSPLGIGATATDDTGYYLREVHRHFRPELVNRIDQIIPFHSLTGEQVAEVARLGVEKLRQRRGLLQRGITLDMPPEATAALAESGYQEAYGARAMRRQLDQQLVVPVARVLSAAGKEAQGGRLELSLRDGALEVELHKASPKAARNQLGLVHNLQAERRNMDALFRLEAVVQLEEQIAFLVAQLSQGEKDERGPGSATVANLRGEHHRLDGLWRNVQQLRDALVAAEELALMALFEQQDVQPFIEDANEQLKALTRHLPAVLLALQPKRDDITLLLQEAGEGRGLDRWLLPLLKDAPRRRWVVEGRPSAISKSSERKRKWDEPLGPESLHRALEDPERKFHEVLLSVHGPNAGVFLALEAGLHRFHGPDEDKPPLLIIKPVAMRSSLSDKELSLPVISPAAPPPIKQLRLMPAVREHLADGNLMLCGGARMMMLEEKDYFPLFESVLLEHIALAEFSGGLDRESTFSFELDHVSKEAKR
jgi:ATP-dependent Clp protease ATP-binding subunit ClpC